MFSYLYNKITNIIPAIFQHMSYRSDLHKKVSVPNGA